MRRFFQHHGYVISQLLALVLFFNIALPPLAGYAAQFDDTQNYKIPICTLSGIKYISPEDYGKGELPSDYDTIPRCPLCILNHSFVAAIPAPDFVPFSQPKQITHSIFYQDSAVSLPHRLVADHILTRAPPAFL